MLLLLLLYHAFPVEPPHELHELVVMCYSIALTDCENLFSSKQPLNALVYLHPDAVSEVEGQFGAWYVLS